jgi:hypothetical protein
LDGEKNISPGSHTESTAGEICTKTQYMTLVLEILDVGHQSNSMESTAKSVGSLEKCTAFQSSGGASFREQSNKTQSNQIY